MLEPFIPNRDSHSLRHGRIAHDHFRHALRALYHRIERFVTFVRLRYLQPYADESATFHRRVGEHLRPVLHLLIQFAVGRLDFDTRQHIVPAQRHHIGSASLANLRLGNSLWVNATEFPPTITG